MNIHIDVVNFYEAPECLDFSGLREKVAALADLEAESKVALFKLERTMSNQEKIDGITAAIDAAVTGITSDINALKAAIVAGETLDFSALEAKVAALSALDAENPS